MTRSLFKTPQWARALIALAMIPVLMLGSVVGVNAATPAEDLELVRQRLIEYYLTVDFFGDGSVVKICTVTEAGDYLKAQNADGSWDDVDYLSTVSSADGVHWSPYLALDRIQAMAVAYCKPDHPYYQSAEMLQGVEKALLHWRSIPGNTEMNVAFGPWSVNWWENSIGPQIRMGRVGVLLRDVLSTEAKQVILDKLPKNDGTNTGQNEMWRAQNALFRAITDNDPTQFAKMAGMLNNKMTIQTGSVSQEAMQVDGSYHGHGVLFMNHYYGMALYRDMSLWCYVLRDTQYAVSNETVELLADYMLNGSRWSIRGDIMEASVGYTACGEGGFAYNYYAEPIRRMMAVDKNKENLEQYQILLDNITGKRTDNGLSGFHYMWTCAYASQMREGYGVNVRMDSKDIKGSEWRATWSDTDYGNLIFWTTAGATTVTVDGDEYTSIYPTFDWRHTPGATAPFALAKRYGHFTQNDMAMGVDNGHYGATAMSYSQNDSPSITSGKVGYFFFDDEYVALGAGITSNSAAPVHTTLNQTKSADPQTAAGAVTDGTNAAAVTGNWAYNNKVGYVFLQETDFYVSSLDHNTLDLPTIWGTGISQFGVDNMPLSDTYSVTDRTFSLWIDHGVRPKDSSYAYIVVPNKTAEQTAAYAADIPVTILVNNTQVQAVRHEELQQTQINFYAAGAVMLDENTVITADGPCSVIVDRSGDTTLLTAAVPSNSTDNSLVLKMSDSEGDTTTRFVFAPAPHLGQSVTLAAGEDTAFGGLSAAFDGKADTTVALSAGESITRDFESSVYLTACTVQWQGDAVACTLEGSNDSYLWTSLGELSAEDSHAVLDGSYRYMRLTPQADGTVAEIAYTTRDLDFANRENMALNKPVTVSGENKNANGDPVNPMANAVDGKTDTRWASNRDGQPMWIYVDLGEETELDAVRILWEAAGAEDYTVDVSTDAANWTTVATETGNVYESTARQHLLEEGIYARYVRVSTVKAATPQWGTNIWELEVYSRADATTPEITALRELAESCEKLTAPALADVLAQAKEALTVPYSHEKVAAAYATLAPVAETVKQEQAAAELTALLEKAAAIKEPTVSAAAWQFLSARETAAKALLDGTPTADELTAQVDWLKAAMQVAKDNPAPVTALSGDVNGDKEVNTTDARLVLQYAVGKIDAAALDLSVADVNHDNEVNTTDARLILQFAVGKIENFD